MIGWIILVLLLMGAVSFVYGAFLALLPIVDDSAAPFILGGAGLFGSGLLVLIGAGIYALM